MKLWNSFFLLKDGFADVDHIDFTFYEYKFVPTLCTQTKFPRNSEIFLTAPSSGYSSHIRRHCIALYKKAKERSYKSYGFKWLYIAAWANWKMALERSKDFLQYQFAEHWCFVFKSIHTLNLNIQNPHFRRLLRLKQ